MRRVARALIVHELLERARDRWVLVISALFALLASAVSLYGRQSEAANGALTGPSLVTLASLLIPLVALVLGHDAVVGERERNTLGLLLSLPIHRFEVAFAKLVGRGLALMLAVCLGIGLAIYIAPADERPVLVSLIAPTLLLGLAFLSIGMLLSGLAHRQATAASLVVVVWFLLVFFYDLGLLGLMVLTEGNLPRSLLGGLILGNPAGLYRLYMMERMAGPRLLENLGMAIDPPGSALRAALWAGWIVLPVIVCGLLLYRTRSLR